LSRLLKLTVLKATVKEKTKAMGTAQQQLLFGYALP
jgi:hypothetical protein